MSFIAEMKNGKLIVKLHVIPGARIKKESERFEITSDRLVIKIEALPRKGAANKELISFLAKILGIPRRNIEIVKGEKSREKILRIRGITKEKFLDIILKYAQKWRLD